jgi:hypothetical protein
MYHVQTGTYLQKLTRKLLTHFGTQVTSLRCTTFRVISSARNEPVYAGISYRNYFYFLNFIPELINVYYLHSFTFAHYPCFSFKKKTDTSKFPFRAVDISTVHNVREGKKL